MKWVAVAPFELKLGPNESHGRAASVNPPPGGKKAHIQAKIIVKLQGSAAWGASHLNLGGSGLTLTVKTYGFHTIRNSSPDSPEGDLVGVRAHSDYENCRFSYN